MIRNLLTTTFSRLLIGVINLLVVWICARHLGAEALGTISLIILGISIIQIVTAILAGSSIVFQTSRYNLADLLVIAWLWTLIGGIPVWFILKVFALIPTEFSFEVLGLAILGSVITINQNVFLGKEQIKHYNMMAVLQSLVLLLSLTITILIFDWKDTEAYVFSQFISMSLLALVGTSITMPPLKTIRIPKRKVVIEAFKYGSFLQTANIMQLFNYRLSYYFIEKFFDRATLGVFSLGVQLAESIWIVARSMAVLLYSKISNSRDSRYSVNVTISFIKFSAIVTTLLIFLVVLLPNKLFIAVFQSDFSNIAEVIASLSPGIIAIAISLMLSHYFSGNGTPSHNTISSGLGLISTIVIGLILIPAYGVIGAGITSSVSYLTSMLYQLIVFKKKTSIRYSVFIPTRSDCIKVIKELKESFNN